MQDASQNLRNFIVESFLFGHAGQPFSDEDSLLDAGIIDSTGVLELVMFVEQRFGITIADHELAPENLDSIARLVRFIERKQLVLER